MTDAAFTDFFDSGLDHPNPRIVSQVLSVRVVRGIPADQALVDRFIDHDDPEVVEVVLGLAMTQHELTVDLNKLIALQDKHPSADIGAVSILLYERNNPIENFDQLGVFLKSKNVKINMGSKNFCFGMKFLQWIKVLL